MYIHLFLPEMARIFFILSITQIVITIISGEKSECFMVSSTHLMHQTSQNMKLHIRLTCKSFVFNIVNQRFNISRSKPPWECPWTHSTYSLLSPSHSLYTWRDLTHPNHNSALGEMKLKQALDTRQTLWQMLPLQGGISTEQSPAHPQGWLGRRGRERNAKRLDNNIQIFCLKSLRLMGGTRFFLHFS